MNTFEFVRALGKITPTVIREIGVESVHINAAKSYSTDFSDGVATDDGNVFSDMFRANNSGKTFDNNNIVSVGKFDDWIETGKFRKNLRFIDDNDIELISFGDGADAIYNAFSENNWIAPTAKILSEQTKQDIKKSFIQILKEKL